MAVGVMEGVTVGWGVFDGVNVNVGGRGLPLAGFVGANWVLVEKPEDGVSPPLGGLFVEVGINVSVGTSSPGGVSVGTLEGVADSAANESGMEEPAIGTEIKKVRALAETTVSGSRGRRSKIGS